jgi:uncharacterized protein YndB with AHSA1/START domain
MNETTKRTQAHATFAVERTYPVPVATVWHALSDNAARDQWFTAGPSATGPVSAIAGVNGQAVPR